jgi:hypothetical protein
MTGPPRKYAWPFCLFAVVLLFLEVLRVAFTLTGLPSWLLAAGLDSLAIGLLLWALPQRPDPNHP